MTRTSAPRSMPLTAARYALNPAQWVSYRARREPGRPAVTWSETTIGYAALDAAARALSVQLQEAGVGPGDRVAFLGENEQGLLSTMLATWRLGATYVPVNYRLAIPELVTILRDASPAAVVAGAGYADRLDPVRDQLSPVTWLSTVELGRAPWLTVATEPGAAEPGTGENDIWVGPQADDVAVIVYTSGTTGLPKGVMLSYSNLWWSVSNYVFATGGLENDVNLVMGPMVLAGPLFTLLVTWSTGARVVSMQKFDAAAALRAIEDYRVTVGGTSPLILRMLAEAPGFADADLSSLRFLVVGGGPITPELLDVYASRGLMVSQGYSMSETTAVGVLLHSSMIREKLGSSGIPLPMVDRRVVRPDGTDAEVGETGEILMRGPNVMLGYWHRPEETAAAIDPDGWLHSGDAGYLDADGYLFVVDRIKDMIISGGLNVYAAEVERVLALQPEVADVAVIGLPDERYGEIVTALVVAEPGTHPSLDGLRAAARQSLAGYKLPRRLELVDELPRNATGKVVKQRIRKELNSRSGTGFAG